MPRGNKPPTAPPAGNRARRQPKQTAQRNRAAELQNDLARAQHRHAATPPTAQATPTQVTHFASPSQDAFRVAAALRALRKRAGLTARQLAAAAGMPQTTYKSYEDRYAKPHLPVPLVEAIGPHLLGRGHPPITAADLAPLVGRLVLPPPDDYVPPRTPNARAAPAPPRPPELRRDVPVLAARTAGWGAMRVNFQADPDDLLPRPASHSSPRLFAITMSDASMTPRYDPGERIYCDPTRPPAIGGYAVMIEPPAANGDALAHVGRVLSLTDKEIVLEQHNPPRQIRLDTSRVQTLARILTTAELLGG